MSEPLHIYLGVDPGMEGGLTWTLAGDVYHAVRMPLIGTGRTKQVCVHTLQREIKQTEGAVAAHYGYMPKTTVCFEKVSAMPSDSAKSCFSFGLATGAVKALAWANHWPLVEVLPRDWHKLLRGHGVARATYQQRKAAAHHVAMKLFPGLRDLVKVKKDWGMCDAALIAESVRRELHLGKSPKK